MQYSLTGILPVWNDVLDTCILEVVWVSATKHIPLGLDLVLVLCTCTLDLGSDSRTTTPPLWGFHGMGDGVSLRPAVKGPGPSQSGCDQAWEPRCVPQRGA